MKKHIFTLLILVSIIGSCKKSWLYIVPMGSQVAATTDDYDKVMNDINLYNYSVSGGWQEMQLMGDEVAAEAPYFINKGSGDFRDRYFQWRDSIYPLPDRQPFFLRTHLTQMYTYNKVINEVMSSTGGTDEKKRGIRAEALAGRAWSLWNMANLYCKPYTAATAGADAGFPITTEADVNIKTYDRGTLQATYDFIIKDLTDALTSIPSKPTMVTRWSKPAVEGFLGKVYLFMGKANEALPFLKNALTGVAANGQTSLYNYNTVLGAGGSFLPIDVNVGPVNNPGNLQNDIQEAVVSRVFLPAPGVATSPAAMDWY